MRSTGRRKTSEPRRSRTSVAMAQGISGRGRFRLGNGWAMPILLTTGRRALAYARRVRWPVVGSVAPLIALVRHRRSLGVPRPVSLALVATAPILVATALPRGRLRAAATWAAHMWAYKVAFELPYDDPAQTRARLHVDYPIRVDSALTGEPPSALLQRRLRPPATAVVARPSREPRLLRVGARAARGAAVDPASARRPLPDGRSASRPDLRSHAGRVLRRADGAAVVGLGAR